MEIKNTAITATIVIQSLVKLLENEDVDISSVKFKVGSESNGYESPEFELEKLIDLAYEGLGKIKEQATPEGFVLVDKKQTEDWYLDDHECMWWEHDGIDNSLCDLDPGQVQAVDHKEYLITESNTVYAAKVWDESNDQVGFWEFFKTKDEAEKTAAYCKAKFKGGQIEAQEQSHDNSN